MTHPSTVGEFGIISDTSADVWHPRSEKPAYEWWYFDAMSDDGRDAVVIIFFDNFIFSPRYNKSCAGFPSKTSETSGTSKTGRFPAVAFFYYRDGKAVYRCINEVASEEFSASTEEAKASVGESSFHIGAAPYGPGYGVTVKGVMRGGRRLDASFEWVSIESDVNLGTDCRTDEAAHKWNLAAPRADVSGKVAIDDPKGRNLDIINFRGTGYHDHNHDSRWLPDAVREWQWGRAHFDDATVVYYDYLAASGERSTKLVTVQERGADCSDAKMTVRGKKRDVFGLSYPASMTLEASEGARLTIFNRRPVDSSFFYLRHINDAVLTLPDGTVHKGQALCERLAPRALRWRWLDWLVDMRIGREGRGAFLP